MKPEILYEDNHIIVINKPSGILSQGDSSGDLSLLEILKDYLKKKYNKPGDVFLGLVHRLDRQVSGVMVFAKTSKGARRLHSEIVSSNVGKYYLAIVEKKLPADSQWYSLKHHLNRERDRTIVSARETDGSQNAELQYCTLISTDRLSLVLIRLITGRKHQIRAQFSSIGAPVAGDRKYGSALDTGGRIVLHSTYLSFVHPTLKNRVEFYSPPPKFFSDLIPCREPALKERVLELITAS